LEEVSRPALKAAVAARIRAPRRARAVRERARFLVRDLAPGGPTVATYRLRNSDLVVVLRHHTPDLTALDQVFCEEIYALPPPVARALERLGPRLRVVDLGANIGLFAAYMLERFPQARITAFEPDPFNADILRKCVRANAATKASWNVIEACAATEDGTIEFFAGQYLESGLVPPNRGAASSSVPAVDVFRHLGDIDLLKLDIQGGEWAIVRDPRFPRVPATAIALEYHPQLGPSSCPREEVTRVLVDAGYTIEPFVEKAPGLGELWAWREPPNG
jgi:FkbM family methyltransferase